MPYKPLSFAGDPLPTKQPSETLAILYFAWMGGSSTIGWSAVINCLDYFNAKYPGENVSFVLPLAVSTAQLVVTLVITHMSNYLSYTSRVYSTAVVILALTSFVPLQAAMFQKTQLGMQMILVLLFFLGFANNLLYTSVAGFSSQVGGTYAAYFLIGVAVFGLLMNLLREITVLAMPPSNEGDMKNVLVYFAVTVVIIAVGFVLHSMLLKSEFYKTKCQPKNDEENSQALLLGENSQKGEVKRPQREFKVLWEVTKDTKFYMFLIFLACIQQSFSVPGLMLKKEVIGMEDHTKTISMNTMFSIFYIFGKKLGQYRQGYNEKIVVTNVVFRFLLVFFFIVQAWTSAVPILNTVWFGYLNIAVFGVSMGFANVSLFIMSPEQVQGDKKEVAGFLVVFAINLGTILGGFLSLPFAKHSIAGH